MCIDQKVMIHCFLWTPEREIIQYEVYRLDCTQPRMLFRITSWILWKTYGNPENIWFAKTTMFAVQTLLNTLADGNPTENRCHVLSEHVIACIVSSARDLIQIEDHTVEQSNIAGLQDTRILNRAYIRIVPNRMHDECASYYFIPHQGSESSGLCVPFTNQSALIEISLCRGVCIPPKIPARTTNRWMWMKHIQLWASSCVLENDQKDCWTFSKQNCIRNILLFTDGEEWWRMAVV